MPDAPTYLVTARAVNALAQCIDDIDTFTPRREPLPRIVRSSDLRTPESFRRAWFDYVRESGNDLA